jgi:outer membrane receptor protein involved in Fe transport
VLKPYNNIDMKISYAWRKWSVTLEVNDLLDEQYEHVPRYPMPGRNYRLSLAMSI